MANRLAGILEGFAHTVAVAVDIATFTVISRRYDVTISSWCGVQMESLSGNKFGQYLGFLLNKVSPGHTSAAILADTDRARAALLYLAPPTGA